MNVENLKKIVDHIRTIPSEMFDMYIWRNSFENAVPINPKCDSVGCVIGHSLSLSPEHLLQEHQQTYINPDGSTSYYFLFRKWSEDFTGLYEDSEWNWCFSYQWYNVDNTPEGAARRIEYLLEKGVPVDWKSQLSGNTKLSY